MTRGPLVDVEQLREQLGRPDVVVVDCRFVLGRPGAGRRLWEETHVPGAAFLDLDEELSSEPGPGGRHPLPQAAAFQSAARRAGIGAATSVVAYDEAGEGGAARLWWLLRHFGHDAAAVLDGGLRAWRAAGLPLATGAEQPEPGDFSVAERSGDSAGVDELIAERPRLLDARAPERYRGESEPVDAVAGHIPGAVNVPVAELAPQGRFPPADELRRRLGDEPFVAYCGSGVTACNLVLGAQLAGVDARLYPGSWSEWSRRGREVETGDPHR